MDFELALQSFHRLHQEFGPMLDMGLLVFCRLLSFFFFAPIFNRKDMPFIIRLAMALILTTILVWIIPHNGLVGGTLPNPTPSYSQGQEGMFVLQIMVNIAIGALIGFIADTITKAVYSAGSMMNNQIGLSSALIFDPSSRQQVMVLDRLFGFIVTILFIHIGGLYWLIQAIRRSFEVFPLYTINPNIPEAINMDYLITISGNTLVVATELVAPVIVITMAVDIILGIVNRTAQQMPVFQLSFALKPAIGIAVLLLTLPIFLNAMANFLEDFSRIF